MFYFSHVIDLWPKKKYRSRNDIHRLYSHTFINSICCLQLSVNMLHAAIVSEKSTVLLVLIESYKNYPPVK